jgi:hypothetical protein
MAIQAADKHYKIPNTIPKNVKVSGFNITVEKHTDSSVYGIYDSQNLKIALTPQKKQELIESTLLHETLHAIDYSIDASNSAVMKEEDINKLGESWYEVQRNNKFCLHPAFFKHSNKRASDCFVKGVNGNIVPRKCVLQFSGRHIPVHIIKYDKRQALTGYNVKNASINIMRTQSAEEMQSALVRAFVNASVHIDHLDISSKKANDVAQRLYQFLAENRICFGH